MDSYLSRQVAYSASIYLSSLCLYIHMLLVLLPCLLSHWEITLYIISTYSWYKLLTACYHLPADPGQFCSEDGSWSSSRLEMRNDIFQLIYLWNLCSWHLIHHVLRHLPADSTLSTSCYNSWMLDCSCYKYLYKISKFRWFEIAVFVY